MYLRLVLLLSFIMLFGNAVGQAGKLIWEVDFSGSDLNDTIWNFELGDGCPELCGWGNEERQIYTKTNHRLENGYLFIKADIKDSIYTSTRITTEKKFEFRYGWIESRIKLPVGKGLWPAFWMLGANKDQVGWPRCGEIDIMEYIGKEPGMIFSTLHTEDSHGNSKNTKKVNFETIEEGFHVYSANWTQDKIEFYVDGKLIYTFAPNDKSEEIWPFNQPFYIILNLAIGGRFGGPEVDDSIFPQEFVIDYIRVYEN